MKRNSRNPSGRHDDYSAKSIGESNAAFALDEVGGRDYPTRTRALAAYLVNTCDTAHEYRVSREDAVEAFLNYIKPKRKKAPARKRGSR